MAPRSPLWAICGCRIQPSKAQPGVGTGLSGSRAQRIMGDVPLGAGVWEPREGLPRACCYRAWGCSGEATRILQLSRPSSLTQ